MPISSRPFFVQFSRPFSFLPTSCMTFAAPPFWHDLTSQRSLVWNIHIEASHKNCIWLCHVSRSLLSNSKSLYIQQAYTRLRNWFTRFVVVQLHNLSVSKNSTGAFRPSLILYFRSRIYYSKHDMHIPRVTTGHGLRCLKYKIQQLWN